MWKVKLLEWGLSSYVENFEGEGIDDISFPLIDYDTINKVFIKSGPKLIFQKNFQEYLKTLKVIEYSSVTSVDTISIDSDASFNTSTYSFEPDDDIKEALSLGLPNISESRDKEHSVLSNDNTLINILSDDPSQKRQKLNSVFPEGLEITLKKYTDGLIVLMNKGKLTDDHRKKLAKVLINELFAVYGTKLKESIFTKLSKEIEDFFPNEKADCYYIPYAPIEKNELSSPSTKNENLKRGINPKGKLWHRYINVKAALRVANKERRITNIEKPPATPEKDDLALQSLEFLKVATEPPGRILEVWETTYRLRKRLYVNKELSFIFEEFPCLKLNLGIELIETDFNKKHPTKIDTIYNSWPKVANAVLQESKERKIEIPYVNDADDVTRAIFALPYLFSPVSLKKSRRGVIWRPTRSEVQESFCLNVSSHDELAEKIQNRQEKLNEFNVTLQPFAAIVGPIANPEAYYIIVDDVKYKVSSSIRMIELLYKLFHALDVAYPAECEHVWIFIDEVVYGLVSTKKSASAASVIADIKFYLQENK